MIASKEQVENEVGYVSQLFMNISGFVDVRWTWEGDNLIIYNESEDGSPSDDMREAAALVARLTGWETYEITPYDAYEPYGKDPYYIGLKRPDSK